MLISAVHRCTHYGENEPYQIQLPANGFVEEGTDYELKCDEGLTAVPVIGSKGVWRCENGRWVQTSKCISYPCTYS